MKRALGFNSQDAPHSSLIIPHSSFPFLLPLAQSLLAHLLLFARPFAAARGVVRLGRFDRPERDRGAAGYAPAVLRLKPRRARPAVRVLFARPERRPDLAHGRREPGLGPWVGV